MLKQVVSYGESPSKVPLYLNLQGWIVYRESECGYSETVFDSEKMLNAYEKAINKYEADLYYDMGSYSAMFPSRCLGSNDFYLSDEKYSLNFKDISYITSKEQYLKLAENPYDFLWNDFYVEKFKNLNGASAEQTIAEYLKLTGEHYERSQELRNRLYTEKGAHFLSDMPVYQPAFDYLFQYLVGMKGISLDMRRNKQELLMALESFENLFNGFMDKMSPPLDKETMPFQSQLCLLGQTLTNRTQFEEFIWKHLKKKIDTYVENDYKFYFMVEGACGPLMDYLSYIPDGCCALHVETDSLDTLIEKFGDKFTYVGGMPVQVLGSASLDECRAYTNQVLEKYGHNGNFIFSTDKGIVFESDAKPDNLKLVCDLVNNFKP